MPATGSATRILSIVAAIVLIACSGFVSLFLRNGQDLALVRNSLVFSVATDVAELSASPPSPARYQVPEEIARVSTLAVGGASTDLDRAVAIVHHLDQPGKPRGGMLAMRTLDAYREIRSAGTGYCVDYVQVFGALARAAGVPVREWGISFVGYSGAGHALSEIYSRELGAWVLIDVFNGFYVTDAKGTPLSLLRVREELLRARPDALNVRRIVDDLPFPDERDALRYLNDGIARAYLWTNSDVFAYEANPLLTRAGAASRALQQFVALGLGLAPRMLIIPRAEERDGLLILRMVRTACALAAVAGLVLVVTLAAAVLRRRRG